MKIIALCQILRVWLSALGLLLLFLLPANANPADDSLSYHSSAEHLAIKSFVEGTADYFDLFYYASPDAGSGTAALKKREYQQKTGKYTGKPYSEMKPEKLAKSIYKEIHNDFLTQYEYSILFNSIFDDGKYNCVTASALYALVFEKMGVDYEIRLLPDHVYLVLFPDAEAIKIESTDPSAGVFLPSARMKKQYVDYLKEIKMISEEEYSGSGTEVLFQKYYYASETIDLTNLVGVHYYNAGIAGILEENYSDAFRMFEKAVVFYPDERIRFMAKLALQNSIAYNGVKTTSDLNQLAKYASYISSETEKQHILDYFNQFTYENMVQKADPDIYDRGYTQLCRQLSDSLLRNDISFTYNFETGRYYYKTGNSAKAAAFFEKAFLINPKNIDAQTALVEILGQQLRHESVTKVCEEVNQYYSSYPLLTNNNAFMNLLLTVTLATASEKFSLNHVSEGKKYLDQFERNYRPTLEVNAYLIGECYIAAAVCYYGKGQKALARQSIDKGLEFVPDNYQLLQMKNSF